jgi:hypothetical protein
MDSHQETTFRKHHACTNQKTWTQAWFWNTEGSCRGAGVQCTTHTCIWLLITDGHTLRSIGQNVDVAQIAAALSFLFNTMIKSATLCHYLCHWIGILPSPNHILWYIIYYQTKFYDTRMLIFISCDMYVHACVKWYDGNLLMHASMPLSTLIFWRERASP